MIGHPFVSSLPLTQKSQINLSTHSWQYFQALFSCTLVKRPMHRKQVSTGRDRQLQEY